MNTTPAAETPVLPPALRGWERFWFAPADPTLLGLIRLCCGLITFYTAVVYGFELQAFVGPHAWNDLELRLKVVRDRPVGAPALGGLEVADPILYNELPGLTPEQVTYVQEYFKRWGVNPPRPFPRDREEHEKIEKFRAVHKFDYRTFYTPTPRDDAEWDYLNRYAAKWFQSPPAFPTSDDEEKFIDNYRKNEGHDPRVLVARGQPAWSLWFHVTDPDVMPWVHAAVVLVALLFAVGFCTRVTSVLTWFGMLCYIHRSPNILFGVDTMMTIVLFYLMIGPSGAALSVDRLIARWRRRPDFAETPAPSVTANLAIRMLQVHLCMIYLIAGLAKLQGPAWWNGTAPWGTLASYEFAPMQYEAYNAVLRWIARNELMTQCLLTGGAYFTLAFEIGYPFTVWRPSTRWLSLFGALVLHGVIGIFMGLKTFSLMMLVMNMAFLKPSEVAWALGWFGFKSPPRPADAPPAVAAAPPREAPRPAPAVTDIKKAR